MELAFNAKLYTAAELEGIKQDIERELADREKAAREGEWNTVRQAVAKWCEKYGPITFEDVTGGIGEIDSRSFGGFPGEMFIL